MTQVLLDLSMHKTDRLANNVNGGIISVENAGAEFQSFWQIIYDLLK